MPLLVRAYPLVRSVEEVGQFAAALAERKGETDAFYKRFGVTHESWHVQDTPSGPWLISVTKIRDPDEAAPRFAASTAGFDDWFKAQVLRLSGVDPNTSPVGPETNQVFVWSDDAQPSNNLCA